VDYVRVRSESELAEALGSEGAVVVAGGTDLMVKMHAGTASPRLLVDVSRLEALRQISVGVDGAEIGSAVTIADLLRPSALSKDYPLLMRVLRSLGSAQIRNRATLGGNLSNASPAADSALPLLAYDAEVLLASAAAERRLPLSGFFRGPGRTALERAEYIRTLRIPPPLPELQPFFHKVGRRQALTIAIASVAALISLRGRTVTDARFAVGSVAPTPRRLRAVEDIVRGRELTDEQIEAAQAATLQEISPIDDVRATAFYRREVTADLVARALRSTLVHRPVSP
jgi:CO/xanthine dehydrogenase FAD-binding subunit